MIIMFCTVQYCTVRTLQYSLVQGKVEMTRFTDITGLKYCTLPAELTFQLDIYFRYQVMGWHQQHTPPFQSPEPV